MSAPPTDLLDALAPLLRRLRRQRRAADALAAGAGAAIGAAVGLLAARVGAPAPFDALSAALGTAAVVLAVRAVRHARAPLTPLAAARRAERDPAWRERLSTALEHGNHDGVVPIALLADALARARSLDAVATAPWRWPRRTLTILAAGTLAFAGLAALPARGPLAPGASDAVAGTPAAPSAAAVGDLARDVAAEARRSRDAYLAALAEQLQDLADEAGPGPLEAAARAELDEVLEALAAASGGAISAEQLRADLVARDAELQAEAAANPDGSAPPEAARRAGAAAEPGSAPDFSDVFTRTQEGEETAHPEASVGGGSSQNAPPGEGEFDPSLLEEVRDASPFDGPPPVGAPGELIGAAEEAGAGDSRLAGRGSQALEGDATSADFSEAGAEAVALSGSERDEGRRIEVELPPAEEWAGYDPTLFAVGAWRATPESAVTTDPVPLRYREAAGRYFLPSQETAASR